MQYIYQLIPKEPLCSQIQDLQLQLTSLIGPNKALDYPLPHITLLHSISDNSINAIQVGDQLIGMLPAIKHYSPILLKSRFLDKSNDFVAITVEVNEELSQMRETLLNELMQLDQLGQLTSGPIAESNPRITLAQEISEENTALARDYISQNIDWIPDEIEFDQVILLARDATLNQPYKIIARTTLRELIEQQ